MFSFKKILSCQQSDNVVIVYTGGKFIPVVHLDLRISPRIFEKIRNDPNAILWGWEKLIHQKNQKQKIS